MNMASGYDEIYGHICDVPSSVLNKLNATFVERFDCGVESLFLEMKKDLPFCFEAIERSFSPKICVRTIYGLRKVNLVLVGEKFSLVSDLYNKNYYDLYRNDEEYSFLPRRVRAYYYLTPGFQVVKEGLPQFNWVDLPVSLANRRRLKEYEGVSERVTPCVNEEMKNYNVWCLGSNNDLLIVDEASSRLFYSRLSDLYALKAIKDFAGFWDKYCSFVFRCGSSNGFKFEDYFEAGACEI